MAAVLSDLDDAITYINTIYNFAETPPSSSDEDYAVWKNLLNIAINVWENEEGMLWNELFVRLSAAADGDKTTAASDWSYAVPTDFRFPAGGVVWVGSNTNKTAWTIIKQQDVQLYENDISCWCYFQMDGSPTLEFNPNAQLTASQTINYAYYKHADALSTGTDTFDMSDPMFAVYYATAELKKEEGNAGELAIATQKLNAMKTKNEMPAWLQEYNLENRTEPGFGY